jgi:hypothetical protein
MIFLCGGHLLLSGLLCGFSSRLYYPYTTGEWLHSLQLAQTPPFVMAVFAYHSHDVANLSENERLLRMLPALLFGLLTWALLVPVLWILVKRRFEQLTGRTRQMPRYAPTRFKLVHREGRNKPEAPAKESRSSSLALQACDKADSAAASWGVDLPLRELQQPHIGP